MPVEISGKQIRESMTAGMQKMREAASRYKGRRGPGPQNSMRVGLGPDPNLIPRWSLPENVERRKVEGWRIVTASRGHLYDVDPDEIDKTHNCVRRLGQILMEGHPDRRVERQAYCVVLAADQVDGTTDELIEAMENIGGSPRDLENDPRYARRLQPYGEGSDRHRKMGQTTTDENKRRRELKLFKQIQRDMAVAQSTGLSAATAEQMPTGAFDPNILPSGHRITMEGGVREIVLSANPDISDFE